MRISDWSSDVCSSDLSACPWPGIGRLWTWRATGREMATILFIEDETPLRRMIAAELREAGYAVHEASNGREGLDAVLVHRPDPIGSASGRERVCRYE